MRVISGLYKRRKLVAPAGSETTRPTADRVKENIFNILGSIPRHAVVLDLFSGSGALGIEALSRGASSVFFVEVDRLAIQAIQKNLRELKVPDERYALLQCDADTFLKNTQTSIKRIQGKALCAPSSITLILADPPYKSNWYTQAIEQLESSSLIHSTCSMIVERASKNAPTQAPEGCSWSCEDSRKYGSTTVEFWYRGDTLDEDNATS